jgi:hypothetical protein
MVETTEVQTYSIHVNGVAVQDSDPTNIVKHPLVAPFVVEEPPICACGQPYDFGCHGVRDGQVYSEYQCRKCHNKDRRDHV